MKIGVVGCGALGSFYGARFLHAGLEVHFLLRSDYGAVRRLGVQVRGPEGDFHVRGNIKTVVRAAYVKPAGTKQRGKT